MLDGVALPNDAIIRNFQQGKAGYVDNAMEQSLLLSNDMADLKSMRKHEVFLSLKRDLAMVSPLVLVFFFSFFFKLYLLPLLGHPSYVQGQGNGEQLPPDDEGRGGKAHCGYKRQCGQEKGVGAEE